MRPEIFHLQVVGEPQMHCTSCERHMVLLLEPVPGVHRVQADHRSQTLQVAYDAQRVERGALLAQIRSNLAWVGYQVQEVPRG